MFWDILGQQLEATKGRKMACLSEGATSGRL